MQWLNVRGVSKMIESIKNQILNHLNKEVKVVSKENRNKTDIFYGNITESHGFSMQNRAEQIPIDIFIEISNQI